MVFGRTSKVKLLEKIPLFRDLSQGQLEQIARLADEIDAPAGKRLAIAGDTGRELFVIIEGQAMVTAARSKVMRTLSTRLRDAEAAVSA